jgi:hypothetical protein
MAVSLECVRETKMEITVWSLKKNNRYLDVVHIYA